MAKRHPGFYVVQVGEASASRRRFVAKSAQIEKPPSKVFWKGASWAEARRVAARQNQEAGSGSPGFAVVRVPQKRGGIPRFRAVSLKYSHPEAEDMVWLGEKWGDAQAEAAKRNLEGRHPELVKAMEERALRALQRMIAPASFAIVAEMARVGKSWGALKLLEAALEGLVQKGLAMKNAKGCYRDVLVRQ